MVGHCRYLNGNSLTGPIPSELGALTALRYLQVPSLPSALFVALLVRVVVVVVEEEGGVASCSPPLVTWST